MWTCNLSLEGDLAREAAPDFQVSCCDRLHASRPKSVGLYTPRNLWKPARLSWSAYLEMVVGSQAGLVLSKSVISSWSCRVRSPIDVSSNPSVSKRKTYKTKQLARQSISWNAGPDDEPLAPDPVPRSVKGLTALRLRNDGRYLRSSRRRPAPMATEATPERDSCAILTRMFSTCVVTVRMEIPSSEAIC